MFIRKRTKTIELQHPLWQTEAAQQKNTWQLGPYHRLVLYPILSLPWHGIQDCKTGIPSRWIRKQEEAMTEMDFHPLNKQAISKG